MKSILGNGITYGNNLEKLCRSLKIPKFMGVFGQDMIPFDFSKQCSYILNTAKSNQKGEHWVAIWQENGKIYVFDSFGRNINRLLPYFDKNVGGGIIYNDNKKQYDYQEDCGQRCISFLLLAKKFGIHNAIKL
jgi:hypothetical protein